MGRFCLLGMWMLAISGAAQTTPVPVDQEPHHHVVFKNEFVLVMRVTIPPNEYTLYHVHSNDRAAVHITNNTVAFQLPDKGESAPQEAEIGEISASTRRDPPYTHRVHNFGPGTFEVMDVEFLQRPKEKSPAAAAKVAAENESARLYNWILPPGASSAQHTHTRPYLIVAVKAMPLRMTGPDGKSLSEETKPGDFHWVDSKVTHTLTNDGEFDGQIVEIELK